MRWYLLGGRLVEGLGRLIYFGPGLGGGGGGVWWGSLLCSPVREQDESDIRDTMCLDKPSV